MRAKNENNEVDNPPSLSACVPGWPSGSKFASTRRGHHVRPGNLPFPLFANVHSLRVIFSRMYGNAHGDLLSSPRHGGLSSSVFESDSDSPFIFMQVGCQLKGLQ